MQGYQAITVRVQAGQLKLQQDGKRQWQSAIEKTALEKVSVTLAGLAGDEHTGVDSDRAVCCHPLTHYRFWEGYYHKPFPIGILAENLTLRDIADEDVCVGDIVRCGSVLMQVTQPRTPCWKPAQHVGEPDFVKRVEQMYRYNQTEGFCIPKIYQNSKI